VSGGPLRPADVDAAVAAARASFETGPWRRMEPKERKRILRRFAELIRADVDRLRCSRRATSASRS